MQGQGMGGLGGLNPAVLNLLLGGRGAPGLTNVPPGSSPYAQPMGMQMGMPAGNPNNPLLNGTNLGLQTPGAPSIAALRGMNPGPQFNAGQRPMPPAPNPGPQGASLSGLSGLGGLAQLLGGGGSTTALGGAVAGAPQSMFNWGMAS